MPGSPSAIAIDFDSKWERFAAMQKIKEPAALAGVVNEQLELSVQIWLPIVAKIQGQK
jgi:hypothetical protein